MKDIQTLCRNLRLQNGLTLIEVLIVFAIVSILAVVSMPLYQGYRLKTKIGTGIVTLGPLQRLSTEHYFLNGSWPADNLEAGANTPDTYAANFVTSVSLTDTPSPGAIVLTYDNTTLRTLGNKNTLVYYPVVGSNGGGVTWKCDAGTMDMRYRPGNCRT